MEEKCKKCGTTENVNFDGMCEDCYNKTIGAKKNDDDEIEKDYVYKYRIIIFIIAIIIFAGGLILAYSFEIKTVNDIYENTSMTDIEDYMYESEPNMILAFSFWGAGALLVVILCMLKDIINELRILNNK